MSKKKSLFLKLACHTLLALPVLSMTNGTARAGCMDTLPMMMAGNDKDKSGWATVYRPDGSTYSAPTAGLPGFPFVPPAVIEHPGLLRGARYAEADYDMITAAVRELEKETYKDGEPYLDQMQKLVEARIHRPVNRYLLDRAIILLDGNRLCPQNILNRPTWIQTLSATVADKYKKIATDPTQFNPLSDAGVSNLDSNGSIAATPAFDITGGTPRQAGQIDL